MSSAVRSIVCDQMVCAPGMMRSKLKLMRPMSSLTGSIAPMLSNGVACSAQLRIAPGDIVVAETKDAFESRIKAETDSPTKILKIPFLNPQCGPIAVEGAANERIVIDGGDISQAAKPVTFKDPASRQSVKLRN